MQTAPMPRAIISLALFALAIAALPALGADAASTDFEARARKAYWDAKTKFNSDPKNAEAGWQFARTCFDVADFAANSTERADLAEQGISACREVIALNPQSAAAHYYLGMNFGQLAQTKGLAALKIVNQMEREFNIARQADEDFDQAGPDRNLGLLYRDAPSFGSIGSRSKARQHLTRAVELAPDFPENRLNLAESCLKWNDRNGAIREVKALEEAWPRARETFAGDEWTPSWLDWKKRLQNLKKKLEEASKALESPSHKP